MKKIISFVLVLSVVFSMFSIEILAKNAKNKNEDVEYSMIEKELDEFLAKERRNVDDNERINIDRYEELKEKYEVSMKNKQDAEVSISLRDEEYAEYQEIRSRFKRFIPESQQVSTKALIPYESTQVVYEYAYSNDRKVGSDSETDMVNYANQSVGLALNFAHPAVGVIYSILNFVISESETVYYSDVLLEYVTDKTYVDKIIQVYGGPDSLVADSDGWIDEVVIASKRNIYGSVEMRYYKNGTRKIADPIDLGLIETQYNKHYSDTTYLKDEAVDVFSGTFYRFPRRYSYTASGYKHYEYDRSYKFDYDDDVFR